MQQNIKCKWLHRSFVFLLSVLVATSFMVPRSLDAFGAQEAKAADGDPVLIPSGELVINDEGIITRYNKMADTLPSKVIIPKEVVKDGVSIKVKGIGNDSVFANANLTSVSFEEGTEIESIGEMAFANNQLTNLDLPDSLKTIGYRAFFRAGNLDNFNMSSAKKLETISGGAFESTIITGLTLPNTGNLKTIGSGAFTACGIGGTVIIPDSVTSIDRSAFFGNILTIDVSAHEPNSLRNAPWITDGGSVNVIWSDKYSINNVENPMYAEDPSLAGNATVNTPFLFDTKQGIIYGLKGDLGTKDYDGWTKPVTTNGVTTGGVLTIPAKIGTFEVKGFSDGAFGGAPTRGYVRKIVFASDSKITTIPFSCMRSMGYLEEITIPDSITSVGDYAFRFSSALKSFSAKNVTTIGRSAFLTGGGTDDIKLASVTLESDNVTSIASNAFPTNIKFTEIKLPNMKKDTVNGAPWNAAYATVYWEGGSGSASVSPVITDENGEWKFDPKTGTIYAYVKGDHGPEKDLDIPTKLKAGNETYTIKQLGGNNASILGGQNIPAGNKKFRTVRIPKGIEKIYGAFRGVQLASVDFSESNVTVIGDASFESSKLQSISLPDSLTKLDSNAFYGNNFTGVVRIPGNVTSGIASSVFSNCPGITGFDVRMYAHKASDGVYDEDNFKYKNIGSTRAYAPWGASNVGRNIEYRDNPLPNPKATVVSNALTDPNNNTATIKVEAKTTDAFVIVKDFNVDGLNGMPALSEKEFISEGSDPMTTPAKVNMVIDSKSKKDSNNNTIQGGNGTYSLNIIYGGKGQAGDTKALLFTPRADIFKTITYDANAGGKPISGAAPTADDVYVEGYGVTLKDKGAMNIKGYKFAGWNTKADGKGTNYAAGAKFTMPKTNTTLYAKWDENNVKTTFNANGGTFGSSDTKDVTAQEGKLLSDVIGTNPTRTGYRLAGWASTNNATKPDETEVGASAKTVYAVWDANDVRVTYNANGGQIGNEPSVVRDGKVGATIPNIPTASNTTRTGYTFDGWYTDKTDGIEVTSTTFPNANTEYYAHWNANKNTVKFAADPEGTTSQKDVTVLSGKPVNVIPTAQPNDDTEYRFLGQWRCDADKSIYTSEQIKDYVVDGSKSTVTFTAQFSQINKGIVTYDYKGGVDKDGERYKSFEGETDKAFIPDSEVPTPELTGYTLSWSRAKPSVYPSGLITINAVWTPNNNAVTFVVPNGTADPEGKTVKSGQPVGVSPKAEVELGYKFDGRWLNSEDNKHYVAAQIEDYVITGANPEVTFTAQVSERPDWFALDAAINEGEVKIAGEEKDKYTETSVQALEQALEAAKEVLNDPASSDGQLQAEKAAVDAAVKALKTKEQQQADDALAKAKEDAKAELDAVNVNLYEEPELSVVKKAIDDGKKEIDASTTIPQVDAAKKKALDIIAAQKTAAQKADEKKKTEDPKNIPTEVTPTTPANLVAVTKAITTAKNDGDLKGSTYAPLKFQSKKQTKKSIKLQWSKVKGAKQYTVYANQCGVKNKYKKLATVKGKTLNVKKVAGKKLKKGTSYKFLIIAENGDKVSAISKTLHIRTAGHKKYTNYKSVSVKKTVIKKAKKLKKGKTLKLNAKGVVPKGKKVSVHVKTRYESANKKVATVTKAGKVKGIKKGKAKIYCYVQNGLAKVVTVTVK